MDAGRSCCGLHDLAYYSSMGCYEICPHHLLYQAIGNEFQWRAFVSVHPSPNMMEILGNILSLVTDGAMSAGSGTQPAAQRNMANDILISLSEKSGTEPAAQQNNFIKGISCFLSDKRYLVIIDDIWHWEEWEVIRKALPKNNMGCKLIMTTCSESIAQKCETEEGAHVYTPRFGYTEAVRLSAMRLNKPVQGTNGMGLIAEMCGAPPFYYCPLAVICLSSTWAECHAQGKYGGWYISESHLAEDWFLSTQSMKPLVQSLCLHFDNLPVHLRTCLLYCSIYSQHYDIEVDYMVRKWVAEGFASEVEVAEAYFEELLSRKLLQPLHGSSQYVYVHPILRAFLVSKAKEDNFIAYSWPGHSSHAKQIRRLSLSTDRYPDVDPSHTRSLVVGGKKCQSDVVPFKKFENLRVLEIESNPVENGHLVDICGLTSLRYLGLIKCYQITELPREIGKLQNLETLHVADTPISKLPMEIKNLVRLEVLNVSYTKLTELPACIEKLQHLKILDIGGTNVTKLPMEISKLLRLENLNVRWTEVVGLPMEIGKLQHLRTLDIRGTKVREISFSEVPNASLNVLVDTDKFSDEVVKLPLVGVITSSGGEEVISSSEAKRSKDLSTLVIFNHFGSFFEVPPVWIHRVGGRHMNVPQWVKQDLGNVCSLDITLCKLVDQDLQFLKQMPNLQALQLRFEVLPREPVAITGGGFSKLETLYVECRLPNVITFQERAMPELKRLEFKFYTGTTTSQDYSMGINHLSSLEKVVFRCSKYYTSDGPGIIAMIEVVRKEAAEHHNEITVWVDDKEPEVFGRCARWISNAEKDIMQKKYEERERIKKQRERLYLAAEERAQRDKNNATGGIRS